MEEKNATLKDGMPYTYFYCKKCKDEFLDMNQLHEVAELYRKKKKTTATLSKWGSSLGIRIPKELVQKYKLKEKSEVTFIPEENGIRMIL
jgi:hypothetical protein